jgi:hypothetical protein
MLQVAHYLWFFRGLVPLLQNRAKKHGTVCSYSDKQYSAESGATTHVNILINLAEKNNFHPTHDGYFKFSSRGALGEYLRMTWLNLKNERLFFTPSFGFKSPSNIFLLFWFRV